MPPIYKVVIMDLLKIGKYGVKNAQTLLNTTSNKISNVSTEGYTRRQSITYTSTVDWGVGENITSRVYNQFVQRQMYSDLGAYKYYEAYKNGMSSVDNMLSNSDMSISTSFNSFFDSLSDAVQNPTSAGSREEVIAEMTSMMNRFNSLNGGMKEELAVINDQVKDDISTLNENLKALRLVNMQIRAFANKQEADLTGSNENEQYLELFDQRDLLINKISSLVDTSVTTNEDGSYSVYMKSGQLLCNAESYAEFSCAQNDTNPTKLEVYMTFNHYAGVKKDLAPVKLGYEQIGGSIQGRLDATNEIRQTMRDLGQLAMAFADCMNVQNAAGITLAGTSGGDLFSMPEYIMGVGTVAGETCHLTFNYNEGANYPDCDFLVAFDSSTGSADYSVFKVDANGKKTEITSGITPSATAAGGLALNLDDYGVTLTFNKSATDMTGIFVIQPTIDCASLISVNASKAEDLAFASAVVTFTGDYDYTTGKLVSNNKGDAVITLNGMTLTGDSMGVSISATSSPSFNSGAPAKIVIAENNPASTGIAGKYVYQIQDTDGNVLGYTNYESKGQNIFANAVWTSGATYAEGYPGYDVSVSGNVEPGDVFSIAINENPNSDNSNGVKLAAKRTADAVATNGVHDVTFSEGYANLTSRLGSAVMAANTDCEAAETKYEQTRAVFDSAAGVQLDEEAASLIQYQQTYTACAKIIQASQTVFDSLLSAM